MRFQLLSLYALLASGTLGCAFGEGDAKVPGDDLGKFHVVGELDSSTCGAGALGSSDVWEFELRLSRDLTGLYWLNGREVISGEIANDGVSFEVRTRLEVDVLEPAPGFVGCTLERYDHAQGKLSSASTEVKSFQGTLGYEYRTLEDSDCSPLVGVEGGFARLPCDLSYELSATRVVSPEELQLERSK